MRYLAKIFNKLYLFSHPLYLYSVLLIQSSQYLLHMFYIYKYTEFCFIQSSVPYIP